jgi:hypothetical protein
MEENIKRYISWIVLVSILVFIALNTFVKNSTINNFSKTVTIVILLAFIYVKWVWRINPLEKNPKLYKNYHGKMISGYDHKERNIDVEIKQTLFSVRIIMKTDESRSKTFMSRIYDDCGEMMLSYGYLNEPNAIVRDKSQMHYGLCTLYIDNAKELKGKYFTDRQTVGDIELSAII